MTDPVGTEDEHLRIDAKRLFQKLRGLKGHLTREVKNCNTKIGQFRTLMEKDADKSIMIVYAREITETFSRCQNRQADIELGINLKYGMRMTILGYRIFGRAGYRIRTLLHESRGTKI